MTLPSHPSLENLKKQAKTLQRKWKAGDAATLTRVRAAHPRYSTVAPRVSDCQLADCQLVLAREAGFESWPQLKVAIEAAQQDLEDLATQFIELACLCYDDPHYDHRTFHVRASELLASHPEVAAANIWAAAAAGNTQAVRSLLDEDGSLVNRPGPHGWAPLICACYSRATPADASWSSYEAAKLLLDCGADPNAHTLKHNDPPGSDRARRFTALTGIFGGGSTGLANQPPHPRWLELAELLLERGADPADEQALWINPGAALEPLLRHGLKADVRIPTADGPITLLGRELCRAAWAGHVDRVRLLLAHGARTDEQFESKTPWRHAVDRGHLEFAQILKEAGAPVDELDDVARFISVCLAGDEPAARAMLARDPDLPGRVPKDLVLRAAGSGKLEAVRLALDLGFDPDWMDDNSALQGAAGKGDEGMVRLLLGRGASLSLRDPWYDSTAVGWADFFDHPELRDFLLDEGPISLWDALAYDRLDRVPDVLMRDPGALDRPFAECISRAPKAEDWQTPLESMVHRGKSAAVRILLEHDAAVTGRHPSGRSLLRLAREKGFEEIARMLEKQGANEGLP